MKQKTLFDDVLKTEHAKGCNISEGGYVEVPDHRTGLIVNGKRYPPGQCMLVCKGDTVEMYAQTATFDDFWATFPRDPMRAGRKSGKTKCLQIWKKKGLDRQADRVMAALDEDIRDIKSGQYAFTKESRDRMHYFPGIQPWLNQDKWDRDVLSPSGANPTPRPPQPPEAPHVPMTAEEKASKLAEFRKLAKQGRNPHLRAL